MNISAILNGFGINKQPDSISELKGGHINSTFILNTNDQKMILQKLNTDVFKNYNAVMENIALTEQIFQSHPLCGITVPSFYTADSGKNFVMSDDSIFRLSTFIQGSVTENLPFSAGFAFGRFISTIAGEKKIRFQTSTEDFHCFSKYFRKLTVIDREATFKKLDKSILRRMGNLGETLSSVFEHNLTLRVTHNDAKINNIIFAETPAVIDLDTVMDGYVAFDYGDLIRSLSENNFDINIICQATEGFYCGLNGLLSEDEIVSLYYGILYVTAELAMRYLIDYSSDSGYFKDKTPSMCLNRANELLNLLSNFINYGDDITSIIYKVFEKQ